MPILPIGHTPAKHGDQFPIRLRFAAFTESKAPSQRAKQPGPVHGGAAGAGGKWAGKIGMVAGGKPRAKFEQPDWKDGGKPDKVEKWNMTTADHKLRAAKAERPSILPPDPDKLGTVQPSKVANAGGTNQVYGEKRWSKVTTVMRNGVPTWHPDPGRTHHKDLNRDVPELHPYPWVGRADEDHFKWVEQTRRFRQKEEEEAHAERRRTVSASIKSIKKAEAAQWEVLRRPPTVAKQTVFHPPAETARARTLREVKTEYLAANCPELVAALGGHLTRREEEEEEEGEEEGEGRRNAAAKRAVFERVRDMPPLSSDHVPLDAPAKQVMRFKGTKEDAHGMYGLEAMLFAPLRSDPAVRSGGEFVGLVLRDRHSSASDRHSNAQGGPSGEDPGDRDTAPDDGGAGLNNGGAVPYNGGGALGEAEADERVRVASEFAADLRTELSVLLGVPEERLSVDQVVKERAKGVVLALVYIGAGSSGPTGARDYYAASHCDAPPREVAKQLVAFVEKGEELCSEMALLSQVLSAHVISAEPVRSGSEHEGPSSTHAPAGEAAGPNNGLQGMRKHVIATITRHQAFEEEDMLDLVLQEVAERGGTEGAVGEGAALLREDLAMPARFVLDFSQVYGPLCLLYRELRELRVAASVRRPEHGVVLEALRKCDASAQRLYPRVEAGVMHTRVAAALRCVGKRYE